MPLTPQDIQSQQFHVRFRGFDVDEVDDFLEKVADDYLTAIQENKQLKERLDELNRELNTYRDQGKSFQKAIISAQQIADEMKEKSESESRDILEHAQQEADRLRQEAHEEIASLEKQLDLLSAQKVTIKEELKTALHSYLQRLDEEIPLPSTSAPPSPEPAKTSENSPPQVDDFPEVDDLYQKIDIPDDDFSFEENNNAVFSMDDDQPEDEEETMPDLEGEMLFNLDDPLDDLTPDIKIKDEDK